MKLTIPFLKQAQHKNRSKRLIFLKQLVRDKRSRAIGAKGVNRLLNVENRNGAQFSEQ
ncbi:MAG: hypothetical protein R6U19_04140 [Bacteroidales bacterium]